MQRPTTASSQGLKLREMEDELKQEKREKKKLMDEIELMKKELQKTNFQQFTQSSAAISASSGRLPPVPGVREVTMADLEVGEQISQGGFSVIH